MNISGKNLHKSFNEYVMNERLMHIDDDIDFIYDTYFKSDIDKIEESNIITNTMFQTHEIDTSYLKSPLSKKVHNINPCAILINHIRNGNYYSPLKKEISISINRTAIKFVMGNNGDIKAGFEYLKKEFPEQAIKFSMEFTDSKIKGSIHHELVHWIDDTLHNKHIFRRSEMANKENRDMQKRGLPINADKLEIQSQIHNIVQLKRKYIDKWDWLTFKDLLDLSPTLSIVNSNLSYDIRKKWKTDLIKRMHREGLLGKNMI